MAALAFTIFTSGRPASQKLVREKPDMDSIKATVSDPKSPYYYPKLMKLFETRASRRLPPLPPKRVQP